MLLCLVVNPRRACAVRVTVSVCVFVCVCVCVCLSLAILAIEATKWYRSMKTSDKYVSTGLPRLLLLGHAPGRHQKFHY